jgi:hypothetical protein
LPLDPLQALSGFDGPPLSMREPPVAPAVPLIVCSSSIRAGRRF